MRGGRRAGREPSPRSPERTAGRRSKAAAVAGPPSQHRAAPAPSRLVDGKAAPRALGRGDLMAEETMLRDPAPQQIEPLADRRSQKPGLLRVKAIATSRPLRQGLRRREGTPALLPNIFTRPDGGSARSARPRLMEAIMVDRTAAAAAEITTLRQELAAANARIQEMGDKDNASSRSRRGPQRCAGHRRRSRVSGRRRAFGIADRPAARPAGQLDKRAACPGCPRVATLNGLFEHRAPCVLSNSRERAISPP
jgi:hypothetical protein